MFIDEETADKRIAVPFDFDMSGLVNAKYAAPPSYIPIKSVRTRYFRGLCQPRDVLDTTIDRIRSKRDEIMALIDETEGLSRLSRNRVTKYLTNYYKFLDDSEALKTGVIDRCRGMDELLELTAKEQSTASN